MPEVLVLGPQSDQFRSLLEPRGLPGFNARYCEHAEPAAALAGDIEVIFGPPAMVAGLIDQCSHLRWVQSTWAGVRPLVEQPNRDFQLTGVKGIFGELMSEYVLAWLLGIERKVIERAAATSWDPRPDNTLSGRRIGILGTGSIGQQVATSCRMFGLHVVGLNTSGESVPGFDHCYALHERLAFAQDLHYLVSLLPDTPKTSNIVDASLLQCLRRGAVVINAGRANAIVSQDLIAALRAGQLRGAILDVLPAEPPEDSNPLWREPNLYITSHTAAPTLAERVADVFAENYVAFIESRPLAGRVDFSRGY
ncbi:MAG: D-2-hydroxyacid dehydrogenase [Halioglobus sp.]